MSSRIAIFESGIAETFWFSVPGLAPPVSSCDAVVCVPVFEFVNWEELVFPPMTMPAVFFELSLEKADSLGVGLGVQPFEARSNAIWAAGMKRNREGVESFSRSFVEEFCIFCSPFLW